MNPVIKPKRVKIVRRIRTANKHPKAVVPYDTGKVKIGLLYTPPQAPMDADAEVLQANLMGWPLSIERRVADWLNNSPWSSIGAVAIVLFLITLMKGCVR